MSSLFCPCLLVMVQDNNWLRFGQNNIVNTLLHGWRHCMNLTMFTGATVTPDHHTWDDGLTYRDWRVHMTFADVTGNIDTRHCHAVSHVTTSPGPAT